jgi:hypothetical protein
MAAMVASTKDKATPRWGAASHGTVFIPKSPTIAQCRPNGVVSRVRDRFRDRFDEHMGEGSGLHAQVRKRVRTSSDIPSSCAAGRPHTSRHGDCPKASDSRPGPMLP